MRRSDPPENTSPEAVALRQAAIVFANGADEPVHDYDDVLGQARNRELLAKAVAYAMLAGPPLVGRDKAKAAIVDAAVRWYTQGRTGKLLDALMRRVETVAGTYDSFGNMQPSPRARAAKNRKAG